MSQALAMIRPQHGMVELTQAQPLTLNDIEKYAKIFQESGMFADIRSAAQAMVKVIAGQSLNLDPFAAMQQLHIISGKVTPSANLIAQRIKQSGRYDYRIHKLTNDECSVEFFENGQSVGIESLTLKDAIARGLTKEWDKEKKEMRDKYNWKAHAKNMLFARCISNGAKFYAPDVLNGNPIYVEDELTSAEPRNITLAVDAEVVPKALPELSEECLEQIFDLGFKLKKQPSFLDEVCKKAGVTEIKSLPQDKADALIDSLTKKLDSETRKRFPNFYQPTVMLKAETVGALLNAILTLEATGTPESEWQQEVNNAFTEYEAPVQLHTLSEPEIERITETLAHWAELNLQGK